jgi:hypothetical protein
VSKPVSHSRPSSVHYDSVIAALEGGEGYAVNIAQYTGKHVSTVRKILRQYEAQGIAAAVARERHRADAGLLADRPDRASRGRAEKAPVSCRRCKKGHELTTGAGRLVRPECCERCGTDEAKLQGHHEDYAAPLDVQWLCHLCHSAVHKGIDWMDREGLAQAIPPAYTEHIGGYLMRALEMEAAA